MIANYHTHTYRCGHAEGSERDYVQQAIEAGIGLLGFSDHTPWDFFDSEPQNRPVRMTPEELPDYAETVRGLAREYRDRIEIHLGVEAEYYPKYFPRLLELLRQNRVEYMILGQHYIENEIGETYNAVPFTDRKKLERYVSQSAEAMDTGLFTYFAHPDLIHYVGDDAVYEREMRKLCRVALKMEIPLELNLLGIRESRHYPNEFFWRIVAEEGNTVILGSDAHSPEQLADRAGEQQALALIERLRLNRIETIPLRRL